MRFLYVFFLFLFVNCHSQISKDVDGFADANYRYTDSKSNAKYYLKRKLINQVMMPSINPNASSLEGGLFNEGYGTTFNLPVNSGVSYQEITFYNFRNEKELVAGALVQGNKFELYNLATWYGKNGNKKEIGFFKNGVRGNLYETYDKNGKVTSRGYYVNGKKVTNFNYDKRLHGKWQHKYIALGYFNQQYKRILYNQFHKDGNGKIWDEEDVEENLMDVKPDVATVHYNFQKTGNNTGVLKTYDYFSNIIYEETIEFIGSSKLISTITKHSDKSLLGKRYEFVLVSR